MMNAGTTAEILKKLDVCRSLFYSLAYQLENNAGIADYWPLSVLAAEGQRKIGGIADMMDRARMEAEQTVNLEAIGGGRVARA
jgi:hypothetical protein